MNNLEKEYEDFFDLYKVIEKNKNNQQSKKLPLLNKKNRDFIDAVLYVDSNYNLDPLAKEPDKKFMFKLNSIISGEKEELEGYAGSSSYWFERVMKNDENAEDEYKKAILGSIISIDRSNSTHLEAIKGTRLEILNRIIEIAPNKEQLEKELKNDDLNENHILFKITDAIIDNNNEKNRFNLSFASKFCAYASKIILGEVKYPKYDSVVSDNLFYFYNKYVDENSNKNKNTYKINHEIRKIDEYINKYLLYTNDIKKIVEKVKMNNEFSDFNIEDLDHIIWYFLKGQR
ncbi:hypothetical protein AAW50_00665 [Mycoplasmopsis canis]|uniref:hypothetical protein n=1 Tax=Mycoplasmopsis canis TaxID=29555 RepID=UPI0006248B88|nr:hypothetical protein [Mycoplasmopsis canis]AKF40959.1 hypothetical protein AAW50_00665 [Mycoplasmopsis canis]